MECKICNTQIKSLLGLSTHIRSAHSDLPLKQYYIKYLNDNIIPTCEVCGSTPNFIGLGKGFSKTCSMKCSNQSPTANLNRKNSIFNKYGVDNVSKLNTIKNKKIMTCIKNHGVAFGILKPTSIQKVLIKKKPTQEYINQIFEDAGCECLGIYENNRTKMKYKCNCGNISNITLSNFKKGHRCKLCGFKKLSKENNPNWNPDRNKIRTKKQIHVQSSAYKQRYRKLHNITDPNLHVDHIFPINAFVEHGIYDLDIINDFDNFQLLSSAANISKGGKYDKNKFNEKYKYILQCINT